MKTTLVLAIAAVALVSTDASAQFSIRKARNAGNNPAAWPQCKVYQFTSGPNKGDSVSANGAAGGPPSYSPDASKCPQNGYFVQGPPR